MTVSESTNQVPNWEAEQEWFFIPSHCMRSCRTPTKKAKKNIRNIKGHFFLHKTSNCGTCCWRILWMPYSLMLKLLDKWMQGKCTVAMMWQGADKPMDGCSLGELDRFSFNLFLNLFLQHLERANVRERIQGSGDPRAVLTAANLLLCIEKLYLLRRNKLSLTLQELIFYVESKKQQTDGFSVTSSGYCLCWLHPCLIILYFIWPSAACSAMWLLSLIKHGQHEVPHQLIVFNFFLIILLFKMKLAHWV